MRVESLEMETTEVLLFGGLHGECLMSGDCAH